MAGLTQSVQQAALDYLFPTTGGTDYIAYSANGTSETASLAGPRSGRPGGQRRRQRPQASRPTPPW